MVSSFHFWPRVTWAFDLGYDSACRIWNSRKDYHYQYAFWILEHEGLNPGFLVGGVPENFGISASTGAERFLLSKQTNMILLFLISAQSLSITMLMFLVSTILNLITRIFLLILPTLKHSFIMRFVVYRALVLSSVGQVLIR